MAILIGVPPYGYRNVPFAYQLADGDSFLYPVNDEPIQWDGRGIAYVTERAIETTVLSVRPYPGAIIRLLDFDLLVLECDPMRLVYKVMVESVTAHLLLIEKLRYNAELRAMAHALHISEYMHDWKGYTSINPDPYGLTDVPPLPLMYI